MFLKVNLFHELLNILYITIKYLKSLTCWTNNFSRFVDISKELPKRIFKEDEEPQVTQINNYCRINYIIWKFKAWLPKELDVVKKETNHLNYAILLYSYISVL